MRLSPRSRVAGVGVLCLALAGCRLYAQEPAPVTIPPGATILEGVPSVRVELTPHAVTRRVLGTREAAENRLEIRVRNGQFFRASRGDELLRIDMEGAYTYLSSKPGHYIKFTKVKDKITYVEHLENRDFGSGSVTYWGELSIVLR